MARHPWPVRRRSVAAVTPCPPEWLEPRLVLSLEVPPNLVLPLDPAFDQFGDQIAAIMAYGDGSRAAFSIFDSGASAVTFSADDADVFDFLGGPIPIKVPGGAVAGGIGGMITGDVSDPGTIIADGMGASGLTFDDFGFPSFEINFTPYSTERPDIQVFVGTADGSPDLPTITGTPILTPSPDHPSGRAALVPMQGFVMDFGDILPGVTIAMPDLRFVDPTYALAGTDTTYNPIKIPLHPYGADNMASPGDAVSESYLQLIYDVAPTSAGGVTVGGQHFLFDTGAQLSVISTRLAVQLGLDLDNPETTIDVQGVGGTETVPGYTLGSLALPRTDGGTITYTDMPIYVLDVADDIDGILGMNAMDWADTLLFNPHDPAGPSLGVTYFVDRELPPDDGSGDPGFEFLKGAGPLGRALGGILGGHTLPMFGQSTLQVGGEAVAIGDDASALDVTVTRSGGTLGTATVHYATSDGTALAGRDYRAVAGDLTFRPGEVSKTIAVPILGDRRVTGDRGFTLNLSSPSAGATLGNSGTAAVTIREADVGGAVQFAAPALAVDEAAGTATVTVTRTGGAADGVTVAYATADGTAVAGRNYTPTSGTLTFAAGVATQSFTVPILRDGRFAGDLQLGLALSAVNGGGTLGAASIATLTIREADPAPAPVEPPPAGNPGEPTTEPEPVPIAVEPIARPAPLVTVAGVSAVVRKKAVTAVVVRLSGDLAGGSTADLGSFALAALGPARKGRPPVEKRIRLRSAVYDPSQRTVTLAVPKGTAFGRGLKLTLDAARLSDPLGRPLDGDRDGRPGGNFVARLARTS